MHHALVVAVEGRGGEGEGAESFEGQPLRDLGHGKWGGFSPASVSAVIPQEQEEQVGMQQESRGEEQEERREGERPRSQCERELERRR